MNWKDTTSYDKYSPRMQSAWTYENDYLRITVTNNYQGLSRKWVMHCKQLGINTLILKIPDESTPEQAQELALQKVKTLLVCMNESLTF